VSTTTLPPAPTADAPPAKIRRRVLPAPVTGQELVLLGVIAALWLLLGVFTQGFFTELTIITLLGYMAPVAAIGIGMTIIIITGGIDVSVAAGVMVCAVIVAKTMVTYETSVPVLVLIAVAVGAVLGLINGVLIAYGRVQAIIITFGTANLFQFAGLQIFGSNTVNGIPRDLKVFGIGAEGRFLGLPLAFLITIVLGALAWVYLRHTAGGRHFYAIGGDANAARLAGVRVQRRQMLAYVITGALVGLAACFTIGLGTSTVQQNIGSGTELAAIAAVVIGGTSIMGGRGSVLGTILGALLVQTVSTGVTQLKWPSQLSDLFVGIAIIIAVGADLLRERARKNNSRRAR
jgi:ribose transport system permease protein